MLILKEKKRSLTIALFSPEKVNTPILKYIYGIMQTHWLMFSNIKL